MPSSGPDPVADSVADASDDLERADARGPRGFGATRPGAVGTLILLALLVLLFQSQLLENRRRGARSRAIDLEAIRLLEHSFVAVG